MSIWDELKLVHLASSASFSRGISYYQSKSVLGSEQLETGLYKGKVKGSQGKVYDVNIDINHPRKSTCNCPFASGRRVICKHMVALYFSKFPQQADAVLASWEAEVLEEEKRYQEWESEYAIDRQRELEEITAYVKKLSEEEVREALISALMAEFDSDYPDYDDYEENDYYY